jgi:hypothetical protein
MLMRVGLILGCVALGAQAADAQGVVTPSAELPIRESPPGTFFQGKGSQIGVATPGDEYRVLDERSVPTLTGVEKWLKVEPLGDPSKAGWAYDGTGSRERAFESVGEPRE